MPAVRGCEWGIACRASMIRVPILSASDRGHGSGKAVFKKMLQVVFLFPFIEFFI